ncbi:MAG: amino-acid N-acetyltransferase [Myxococcota bacterium]|jgi:amino-acid N-acetyltransferase
MNTEDFVRLFRHAAPYVHAHRGRTFVIAFGGEAVRSDGFPALVHDIALLNALGVRLILVHGARPQVHDCLGATPVNDAIHAGLRVTDSAALECVKAAAGSVRVEIEGRLSMGLANSPMANARIRVAAGNFITARPLGVLDGVDFQHTGEVRRVDAEGIAQRLDTGAVVLLSPLGYSMTGDVFNLRYTDVASAVAAAVGADKLICLCEDDPLAQLPRQLATSEAQVVTAATGDDAISPDLWADLQAAIDAVSHGVRRAHLISRCSGEALLGELYSRDGMGTLVSAESYEGVRPAGPKDVGGLLALIGPLAEQGVLVERPRELLQRAIDDFIVVERDGMVIGCAACHPYPDSDMGELACVAVHPDYRESGRGDQILAVIERKALDLGLTQLFALTTRTSHWFRERGFEVADASVLPAAKAYNESRNSQVLLKSLAD